MTRADRPLEVLLEELAAKTASPGGGAAVAWTGALAASLVEMAAGFAAGRPELVDRESHFRAAVKRAGELRSRALGLGDEDLEAFGPVLNARRLERDDPARPEQIQHASSAAAGPPMALARLCAELAELGADLAETGNPNLVGDAVAGTLLAESACVAAARLVAINLAGQAADPRLPELATLTQRALDARRRVLG